MPLGWPKKSKSASNVKEAEGAGAGADAEEPQQKTSLGARMWKQTKSALAVSDNTESSLGASATFMKVMLSDLPLKPFNLTASLQAVTIFQQREKRRQLVSALRALKSEEDQGAAAVAAAAPITVSEVQPSLSQSGSVELDRTAGNHAHPKHADGVSSCLESGHDVNITLTMRTGIPVDLEALEAACYWSRFAAAAYGWKLLYGFRQLRKAHASGDPRLIGVTAFGKKFQETDAENERILCMHSGLDSKDILDMKWTSETAFDTGHYVALAHEKKAIVVGIRGTFHARDALTDLCAEYEEFLTGTAHLGMMTAARNKNAEVLPVVLTALESHPDYRVVITGHSLGAGTSALLALLWNSEQKFQIECHAFACPPVVSAEMALSHDTKKLVNCYAVNDDIIPRLSFGSSTDLKKWLVNVATDGTGFFHRMFQVMSVGNALGKDTTAYISSKMEWSSDLNDSVAKALDAVQPTERLYLPGRVFFIYQHKTLDELARSARYREFFSEEEVKAAEAATPSGKIDSPEPTKKEENLICDYDAMEESSATMFSDLVMSDSMFTDHMPDLYEEALEITLAKVKGIPYVPREPHFEPEAEK